MCAIASELRTGIFLRVSIVECNSAQIRGFQAGQDTRSCMLYRGWQETEKSGARTPMRDAYQGFEMFPTEAYSPEPRNHSQ